MDKGCFKGKNEPDEVPMLEKSLESYYFDRIEENVEKLKPLFKDLIYSPAAELEHGRRELACLDAILVKERSKWKGERTQFERRWAAAIDKQNRVNDAIPNFDKYYRDTHTKRDRALRQTTRERHVRDQKNTEISRLTKELDKLDQVKNEVESRVDKFSVFKVYLEKVRQASHGEYTDIREITDRFAILTDARSTLMAKNNFTRDTVTRRQKALENDIIMKSNEVLGYRNYLSELQDYQAGLVDQVLRLDDNLLRIKTTAANRTLIIGQIKMAINNLYLQMCKQMHRNPKISPEDTLGQLNDVRVSMIEMVKLNRDIKHMLKAASTAAEDEARIRERERLKAEERKRRKQTTTGAVNIRGLFNLPPLKEIKTPTEFNLLKPRETSP